MNTLVVFSDDWGRHPSSCQHLVQHLLPRFRTLWFNTIGTRVPRLDLYSARRAVQKLSSWIVRDTAAGDSAASDPRIVSPLMWPRFSTELERQLNTSLLSSALAREVSDLSDCTIVTTIPLVSGLIRRTRQARWVYYCVDDLSQWPGLDQRTLEEMERELVDQVDAVVAVSDELVERMASFGRQARLLTHGIDLAHWQVIDIEALPELAAIPAPRVVFWGAIDRRLNSEWITDLSRGLAAGSIVFVGPDNGSDQALWKLAKVYRLGAVDYSTLPAVAAAASVLIMPYADLPVTRAMQPLKFKEYLATLKPVVASRLPALSSWNDACDVVGTSDEFAGAVRARLSTGTPQQQVLARERLESESWSKKAEQFEEILLGT